MENVILSNSSNCTNMNEILTNSACLNPEQIRNYLNEDIDKDQRFDVENHLLDCPLCTDAVEGFANSQNHKLEELPTLDFLNAAEVSEVTTPAPAIVKKLSTRRNWAMRIAASLLLLSIPLGSYLYWQSNETERIIAANFVEESNPLIGALRSGNNSLITGTTLQNGLNAYQNKEFDVSLNILSNVLNTEPNNVLANYYSGMSAAKLKNWPVAERQLKITRINAPDYYDEATWQLIAVYLSQDKMKEADNLLYEVVENDKSRYQKKALEILKKLK